VPDDLIVDRWPHPGAASGPRSSGCRRRRPARIPRRLAWALLLLLAGAGLCALYFCQSVTAPFNSDGAANVLQGQAIVTGNPLLRGWWTSDVSFYTTELPEYALVTALRGLSPDVVHLCGALTYTLTVLLAALVARGGSGNGAGADLGAGRRAGWYGAGLAAGIMLAPSILGGTEVFLENPDHAGTAVPVLLVLLLLGRAPGGRYWWIGPSGACALLTLAQVGDQLTLVAGTAPLAMVSAVRLAVACLSRARRDGRREEARLDGALLAAAAVSAGLARLADLVIRALGGFAVRPVSGVALAPLSQVPANLGQLWRTLVLLFGANNPGPPRQARTASAHGILVGLAGLHAIGLLLAGAGLAAGLAALRSRRSDRVTQLLVAAVVAVLAAGACTTVLRSLSNAHEVAILLPLGAALAGRALPAAFRSLAARLRSAPGASAASGRPPARRRRAGLAPLALGGWLALNAAEVCYGAAWPAVQPSQQAVAAWLVAHHERAGLAGYWQAASTTVTSGGQVLVAPITLTPAPAAGQPVGGQAAAGPARARRAAAYQWEAFAGWYQPARHDARFVIAVTDPAAAGGGLPAAGVRARFGPPAAQYQVGQYVVMLYGYNLLTRLAVTSFPGAR